MGDWLGGERAQLPNLRPYLPMLCVLEELIGLLSCLHALCSVLYPLASDSTSSPREQQVSRAWMCLCLCVGQGEWGTGKDGGSVRLRDPSAPVLLCTPSGNS